MTPLGFLIFGAGVGAIGMEIYDDREISLVAVAVAVLGAILFVSSFGDVS